MEGDGTIASRHNHKGLWAIEEELIKSSIGFFVKRRAKGVSVKQAYLIDAPFVCLLTRTACVSRNQTR